MAAIITSDFRKNTRRLFTEELNVATNYFVGVGKTDSWPSTTDNLGNEIQEYSRSFSAPLPSDTIVDKLDVLKNLMVLVRTKGENIFTIIPRNDWVYNRTYKTYDPMDPRCFDYETDAEGNALYPCYVTSNDKIYICLSNTDSEGQVSESVVPIPSGANSKYLSYHTPAKINNGDDYIWAYVTSLDEDSAFYTDQFVNYLYPDLSTQAQTIKNNTGGMVYGFKVVNGGGSSITEASTLSLKLIGTTRDGNGNLIPKLETNAGVEDDIPIYGNGDESNLTTAFDVEFGPNGIERITYKEPSTAGNPPNWKMGFESASVLAKVNGIVNTDINIIPFVLPYEGLGAYPDNDLPSYYAGVAVDFIGDIDTEAPTGYNLDVRQISLIKDPARNPLIGTPEFPDNDDDTQANGLYESEAAYDCLKYIQVPLGTLQKDYIGRDFIIEQESTGARAWLDYVDNVDEKLYYHQNTSELVNFKRFSAEETGSLKIYNINGFWDEQTYQVLSTSDPEYLPDTGEVIFYENRKPINRNYNQTDEVKLVIQF